MGEFSETIHLWRANRVQARAFLSNADAKGYIVESNERWTSVLPLEVDEPDLIAATAAGLALSWLFAEDAGLELKFFEAAKPLGVLRLAWHRSSDLDPTPPINHSLVEALAARGVIEDFETLRALARTVTDQLRSPRELRDTAAAALGLPAYAWLSAHIYISLEELRHAFPNAEEIL